MSKNYDVILDNTLGFIAMYIDQEIPYTEFMANKFITSEVIDAEISKAEMFEIVEQLKKDGLIKDVSPSDEVLKFHINFKGFKMINDGGYHQITKDILAERDRRITLETRMESGTTKIAAWTETLSSQTSNLAYWTRWLFGATLALVLVEIVKDLISHYCH